MFECQATSVAVVPDHDEEDGVETLCGETTPPSLTTTWELQLTAIQDFSDAAGFQQYTWENNGLTVAFEWVPGDPLTNPTYTGTCQIRAVTVGGEVSVQLTTDAVFPIVGDPITTYPVPVALAV